MFKGLSKKKSWFWSLLLLIVFVVIFYVISTFFISDKPILFDSSTENNQTFIVLSQEQLFNPDSWKDLVNKLFGVPFDLNYYYFCFRDVGSTETNSNGNKPANLTWNINVSWKENNETIIFKQGSDTEKCTTHLFEPNTKIIFQENVMYHISRNTDLSNTLIKFNSDIYANPNKKCLIIKRILFVLSILTIILLLYEIIKLNNMILKEINKKRRNKNAKTKINR